jgi:hypothetical protein
LFQTRVVIPFYYIPTYDVTADGQRFLINTAPESESAVPIAVVMNWNPKTR